jgi:hypothetical protein
MLNLSTILPVAFIILLGFATPIAAADRSWPVIGEIDLSSGFCDFRAGHFHGGVDIRTNGAEGRPVYVPVDGYIWRIKYSYTGYGKGLYLKDSKGVIYQFGHLSRLSDKLEKLVRDEQYRIKRYYLDKDFHPDSLLVKKGDLIAFSGQTGAGPPHLHFETRTAENVPLNPLTNGFPMPDLIPPVIENIGFLYTDSISVFPDGQRKISFGVRYDRIKGIYILDSVVVFSGDFGVEIKAVDHLHRSGPRLTIYKTKLFFDDYLYYENSYDRYDYNETGMVDLLYDYSLAVEHNDERHLLYNPPGKEFSGSRSQYKDGGIFPVRGEDSYGLHKGRVEVYDAAGNKSELQFSFIVIPPEPLYAIEWVNDSSFYLHKNPKSQYADIKDVKIYLSTGRSGWQILAGNRIEKRYSGDIKVRLLSGKAAPNAIQIRLKGESGWSRIDQYIILRPAASSRFQLSYKYIDDGILFNIAATGFAAIPPQVRITYEDGFSVLTESRAVSPNKFALFYRNHDITSSIIRFEIVTADNTLSDSKEVNIISVGKRTEEIVYAIGGDFKLTLGGSNFHSPTYIEINKTGGWMPSLKNVIRNSYEINSQVISLAKPVTVSLPVPSDYSKKDGLGFLAQKKGWRWIEPKVVNDCLTAAVGGFGTYAILKDTEAPTIRKISPGADKTINNSMPEISCIIDDDLSGIEDDRNITVLLDGEWLIPEYDPEAGRLKTSPRNKIRPGKHQLEITVSDRAGNSRIVKSLFYF